VHHDDAIGDSVLAGLHYDAAVRLGEALGYQIPRLDDVLAKTHNRIQIDVELKEGGYEREVLDMLARAGFAPDEYVVTTFDGAALARVRQFAPEVRTGLLLEKTAWSDALNQFERATPQFLAVESTMIDQAGLAFAHEQRVPLVVWTVNDTEMMRQLFRAAAVLGVITDHPADALRVRQETIRAD
jgi:glycerophosphoryl diester phosphodiesterase